jgi:DNA polymerase-3 subunit beta
MKFSCDRGSLTTAALTAARASSPKSPVPALEGLLIEAFASGTIRVTGYDLKTGIVSDFEGDVREPGSIVLGARLFCDIIRRMPDEKITLETTDNFITRIVSANSAFDISGFSAADFPALPPFEGQNTLSIDGRTLRSMINQTLFAVADNESRPIYTGALFEVEQNNFTIVALDNRRLAIRRETLENGETEEIEATEDAQNNIVSFIVPGAALSEVERIIAAEDGLVEIVAGEKHVMFHIGANLLISRRLEGEFFNYKNSISKTGKYMIGFARKELLDAVERVSLIINEKARDPLHCVFDDGAIIISSASAFGKANDVCASRGDGEGMEVGFNNKYLLDALRAAPTDDLRMCMSSPKTACVILPDDEEDDSFLYMVLPVMLSTSGGDI